MGDPPSGANYDNQTIINDHIQRILMLHFYIWLQIFVYLIESFKKQNHTEQTAVRKEAKKAKSKLKQTTTWTSITTEL